MPHRWTWLCSLALATGLLTAQPALADRAEALYGAAEKGHAPLVERYLRAGADPNVPNVHGVPPLIAAVRGGHENVVSTLIAFGASVTQPDMGGATALSEARRLGRSYLVGMLERQTGFAYGVSKLDGRAGRHRLAGGVLEIVTAAGGAMVYRFVKRDMSFDEALIAARALGGPGLDYGMQIYEPGMVTFPSALGEGEPFGHATALILMAGPTVTEVRVTVR